MGYCNNCGKSVNQNMTFCPICGHRLVPERKVMKADHIEKIDSDIGARLPTAGGKDVPQQIRKILVEDETVEKEFRVEEYRLYATDRRLIEVKGRRIRDFGYAHISSITYVLQRYLWLIGVGIVLIIFGVALDNWLGKTEFLWVFLVIGLIIVIIGAVFKEEFIEANVVGVPKPAKYKGQRQTLHLLLQLIRQKQGATLGAREKETKDIDSIEAIRKLAELRDQGILTQEEFEQKKKKLL